MDQDYPNHPYLYEQNKLDTLTTAMLNDDATNPSNFQPIRLNYDATPHLIFSQSD